MPFQRGDVFFAQGTGSVQEYSPAGQLVQTIAGSQSSAGAGQLCFNPNGTRLIWLGVGLFDNSGTLLPSNWGAVGGDRCVADGLGDVYVSGQSMGGTAWTVSRYNIEGNLIRTFQLAAFDGTGPVAIDLAPDECTIYYGNWNETTGGIGRFNVCTNTQEPLFSSDTFIDDLRVLPNRQVITLDDPAGELLDASGQQGLQQYNPGFDPDLSFRTLSLDPDGTSVWLCCTAVFPSTVFGPFRFDIKTGQVLSHWAASGAMAVYGPPLFGNANLASRIDSNRAGTAEAFLTRTKSSGSLTRLHLWVDGSTTAGRIVVGIYSNDFGRPGTLKAEATITNTRGGSWNYVDVPAMRVTAGRLYWVAVLAPNGGGTAVFRDTPLQGLAMVSAQHGLTGLPTRWQGGRWTLAGSLSAYGS